MEADEKLIKEMEEFDDAFPDGIFCIPRISGEPRVKVRLLWDYCKSRGIEPEQLSEEEMRQFLDY